MIGQLRIASLFCNAIQAATPTCNLRPCAGAASEAGLPGVLVVSPGAPDTTDIVAVRFAADDGAGIVVAVVDTDGGAVVIGAGTAVDIFGIADAPATTS